MISVVRRLLLGVAGVASVIGCASSPALPAVASPAGFPPPAVDQRRAGSARFNCGGQAYLIVFRGDRVMLSQPGWEVDLRREMSRTGARYVTREIVFWHDGAEGVLEFGGEISSCRELPDPWRLARDRGIDVRAIGQEPGWFAEIDEERAIHIVYDYAERELTTRAPSKDAAGGRVTYVADAGRQRVTVVVDETPCEDVMSGEPYPLQVTATIGDRTLEGCGRRVVSSAGGGPRPTPR